MPEMYLFKVTIFLVQVVWMCIILYLMFFFTVEHRLMVPLVFGLTPHCGSIEQLIIAAIILASAARLL